MQVMALSRLGEPETRTVFYFAVGSAVAGGVGMAGRPASRRGTGATRCGCCPIGVLAALGQLCMTRAYARQDQAARWWWPTCSTRASCSRAIYSVLLFGDRIDAAGLGRHGADRRQRHRRHRAARTRAAAQGTGRRTLSPSIDSPCYTTLISADAAAGPAGQRRAADGVRLQLRPDEARRPATQQYRKAHIPGAVYANLDTALSDQGTVEPGTARHHRRTTPTRRLGRPPSAAQPREVRDLAVQRRLCQRHAGRGVRPQRRQLLRPPVVDAQVGGPRGRGRARRRPAGLAGGGRRGDRPRRAGALPVQLRARPRCARSPPPAMCSAASTTAARPSSTRAPRRATGAKWSRWTRWRATSPAR